MNGAIVAPDQEMSVDDPSSGTFAIQAPVTLVVEEWQNVQPGRLAWVFPGFAMALEAAGALRNARRWVILAGRTSDVDSAREQGTLLAESA